MKILTRILLAVAIAGTVTYPVQSEASIRRMFRTWSYYMFGFGPSLWANLVSDGSPWVAKIDDSSCEVMSCEIKR